MFLKRLCGLLFVLMGHEGQKLISIITLSLHILYQNHVCEKNGKIASNFKIKTCHFTLLNYSHSCSNVSIADSTSMHPLVHKLWGFL